ncbi:MAG: hypothetical protein GF333_07690 [Candidatus Omnitrophica bacterium]|nr:hypothetical protein [Candidatus Omnitrophota bacterium]
MKNYPTKIVLLWHMHQPSYRHPEKPYLLLPWVRLRGVKDYYGMARMLDRFPQAKAVVNFSGVLLEQLNAYAKGSVKDHALVLSEKKPSALNAEEYRVLRERFFDVHFEHMLKPNPRYLELWQKKQDGVRFSPQEILDLQVWFNLVWFHPYTLKEEARVRQLKKKGKGFEESEKHYVLSKHASLMRKILPLYKKLSAQKKIEVTLSPYYHPILPLVHDNRIVRRVPGVKVPLRRFSAPEDCRWQISESKKIYRSIFGGRAPSGAWPSEGAISRETLEMMERQGVRWVGTDEALLYESLAGEFVSAEMLRKQRHLLYHPYSFRRLKLFFRDRGLSDLVSFVYQGWENQVAAAEDLIANFRRIHSSLSHFTRENVISIMMDGENAWEYYRNNGVDFLETLYTRVEKDDSFSLAYPRQLLRSLRGKHVHALPKIAPGSWINGDFGVWIGNERNNTYWDFLARIRKLIMKKKRTKAAKQARQVLYRLESSDWFWWNTFDDPRGDFERIFFALLRKAYRVLGKKYPELEKRWKSVKKRT